MKRFLLAWLAVASLALPLASHGADPYPSKPVRIVVGFPPGGGADAIARMLADGMSRVLKQAVLVENKPGANTNGTYFISHA